VVKQYPFAAILLKQLQNATNRPETPFYGDVTLAIQQKLHPPASINPVQDISALRSCVTTLLKGGLC
jgi:multiple sugar transport system substrate-binding protein